MSKYIDVDVFIKGFREVLLGLKAQVDPDLTPKAYAYLRGAEAIIEDLAEFPAADVALVRHERWEKHGSKWQCTGCKVLMSIDGTPQENLLYYCPNCGAKMDKEEADGSKNREKWLGKSDN